MTKRSFGILVVGLLTLTTLTTLTGCTKKANQAQCDQMIDKYADLVVQEHFPDGGADKTVHEQERREAALANEFKNCTSEVQMNEFDCAMKSPSSNGIIKCLE